MKKKLLVLAVAGALAAPVAAMADTTIYGQANLSFDAVNNGALASSASANNISSNQSRIGFKGSEDLGDGLSAVYQIEQQINMDTGALDTSTTRDTFAGLSSGSMGTLLLGVHDTPYKMATRGMDLFADTIADNRSMMGTVAPAQGAFLGGAITHDIRLSDVVAYVSPTMSGLTVAIATTAGAETPINPVTKGSAWSLAALYGAGPLNVNFGYQTVTVGSAGSGTLGAGGALAANGKATAWKLGASYGMDAFLVTAIYEHLKDSDITGAGVANTFGKNNWYLGGKFNVNANDAVKLAYTSAGKVGATSVANSDANQLSLGYDHNLSKRTTVYALYSKINNHGNPGVSNYSFAGASTSAAAANGLAGSTPSAWSMGMKHTF